jgi:uncharacterized protein (TIGR00661 family)
MTSTKLQCETSIMSRALFVIGGFGLGNSTRCGALIEKLHTRGLTIDVATSVNGLWYFTGSQHVQNLISLLPLEYSRSNGRISFLRTFLNLPRLLTNLILNAFTIVKLQRHNHYVFIATDSEYSTFFAKVFLYTPVVAINNVFSIFSNIMKMEKRSRNWKVWPALFVEYSDFLIQKYFSDFQIVPVLKPNKNWVSEKTLYCPPLVRKEFYGGKIPLKLSRALVIASGSGIGVSKNTVESLAKCGSVSEVRVVGLEGKSEGKINYLGRQKNISSYVAEADFIVSNGGFSTISEALVSRRPILVIPIENHFEQIQNARFVESLGLGIMTRDACIENDLEKLANCSSQNEILSLDGAEVAANALLSLGLQGELSFGH